MGSRNNSSNKSKLCSFGYVDYIVVASSLAIALAEELNADDLSILATLFAVLSDELALINAVEEACSNDQDDTTTFTAPVPPISSGSRSNLESNNVHKVKSSKRRVIRKKIKKIKKK